MSALGPALGHDLLEIFDFGFGRVSPRAAGTIHRDLALLDSAQKVADRFAGQFSQQVENRKFCSRDADPKGKPLVFVVISMPVQLPEVGFELARHLCPRRRGRPD